MPVGSSFVSFAASCGLDAIFAAIGFSVVVPAPVPLPVVVPPDVVLLVPPPACFVPDVDFVADACCESSSAS